MHTTSTDQLQEFITLNDLKKAGEIILFNALVTRIRNNSLLKAVSEIQIITLPKEIALYILEFVKEDLHEPEMYSTANHDFSFPDSKTLVITDAVNHTKIIIAVGLPGEM